MKVVFVLHNGEFNNIIESNKHSDIHNQISRFKNGFLLHSIHLFLNNRREIN